MQYIPDMGGTGPKEASWPGHGRAKERCPLGNYAMTEEGDNFG
jgi:hypothetical protein